MNNESSRSDTSSQSRVEPKDSPRTIKKAELAQKLDAAGWGLFFVWVGIALLADVGWGIGLLGVGVITLGEQMARRYFGLELEGFWIVVGVLFLAGGIWELAEIQFSMVPLVLIVAGLAVLASAFRQRRR